MWIQVGDQLIKISRWIFQSKMYQPVSEMHKIGHSLWRPSRAPKSSGIARCRLFLWLHQHPHFSVSLQATVFADQHSVALVLRFDNHDMVA